MSIGYDPIGSSPVGAEAPVTTSSYGFVDTVALELGATSVLSLPEFYGYTETAVLSISATDTVEYISKYATTGLLEIAATTVTKTVYSYSTTAELETTA